MVFTSVEYICALKIGQKVRKQDSRACNSLPEFDTEFRHIYLSRSLQWS